MNSNTTTRISLAQRIRNAKGMAERTLGDSGGSRELRAQLQAALNTICAMENALLGRTTTTAVILWPAEEGVKQVASRFADLCFEVEEACAKLEAAARAKRNDSPKIKEARALLKEVDILWDIMEDVGLSVYDDLPHAVQRLKEALRRGDEELDELIAEIKELIKAEHDDLKRKGLKIHGNRVVHEVDGTPFHMVD